MLGVDAVAIEFAGSAGRDDEVSASDDGKPERVLGSAIRCMKCEQTGDPPRFVAGHQNLGADTTIQDRHAETRRFLSEHLDHQPRRARPATIARPASS